MLLHIRRHAISAHSLQLLSKIICYRFSISSSKARRLTKKRCISLLENCKSMKQLKQIHCQILVSSLHLSRDVIDDLMVFCTDPVSGDLNHATKVFETLESRSLFIYNLVIKAFTKKGNLKSALLLFDRMREECLRPDNFTYPFVLKAIGSLHMELEGRKNHALVVKTGLDFDPYVRNSLMGMYADMGRVEISQLLFDEMPERDIISWNVLIAAYVKCGKFGDAIFVYWKMDQEGVKPDEATLVSTLSACVSTGNLELGTRIHRYMNEEFKFSVPLGNALLDMYAKCGSVDMARRFFSCMPERNVISWTSMVSGYVNSGQLDEARQLFNQSPAKDVILWTAMINGYVQYNHFQEAMALFREMQLKRVKPDKYTVAALLTACASLGALEQGKWIHGYIEDNMIKIDAVVGTALIDMYAKCGCIEKSLDIFRGVEGKDTATWTSIICGLSLNGQTSKALELFTEMKSVGAEPDDITFIGVLSACSHGGLVDEGCKYFDAMKKVRHIEPKLEHYGCLVDLLGRAGLLDDAEKLIGNIPNNNDKSILPLWGALLNACRIHGNVVMGERLAKQVIELEFGNPGLHTLVANIYAAADRWDDVTKIRRKMKDLGIKKTPGCSSIEVNGMIHEFLVADTASPQRSQIYSVLNSISRLTDSDEQIEINDQVIIYTSYLLER
ncbi:pentatricopeptide repeat-containing protein At1g31430 [Phoenix dactylifera]|uniref:Pentatricopeptide repeat-containing protein At1g31430 n=1 Tax=Phoenix dactylifera TaxID=42345 RepID=A0A8B8ZI87_PHODC|nr:pentatricopeptide repeat-containing protein At1g31430 [Phoenix dactylifera]